MSVMIQASILTARPCSFGIRTSDHVFEQSWRSSHPQEPRRSDHRQRRSRCRTGTGLDRHLEKDGGLGFRACAAHFSIHSSLVRYLSLSCLMTLSCWGPHSALRLCTCQRTDQSRSSEAPGMLLKAMQECSDHLY